MKKKNLFIVLLLCIFLTNEAYTQENTPHLNSVDEICTYKAEESEICSDETELCAEDIKRTYDNCYETLNNVECEVSIAEKNESEKTNPFLVKLNNVIDGTWTHTSIERYYDDPTLYNAFRASLLMTVDDFLPFSRFDEDGDGKNDVHVSFPGMKGVGKVIRFLTPGAKVTYKCNLKEYKTTNITTP